MSAVPVAAKESSAVAGIFDGPAGVGNVGFASFAEALEPCAGTDGINGDLPGERDIHHRSVVLLVEALLGCGWRRSREMSLTVV